jgi:hypothetical protein
MTVRETSAIIATCALLLASCGPKTLTLPDEPIDRAATCGAVAAAAARAATNDINTPLSLEAIGRVIHYPLLAGSAGEGFSSETATRVQTRMSDVQDSVSESKWQELIPACRAAFPATAIEKVALPEDRFEAQLGCDELGDFLRDALEMQEEYVNELGAYRELSYKLDPVLGGGLRSRGASSTAAQQQERRNALATMARAGPPVAVMRECLTRFG